MLFTLVSIKEFIKQKQESSPQVQKFISHIYYFLKRNSKKIKGHSNKVTYSGAFLSNVEFIVNGNGNAIVIEKGTRLSNLKVYISGDNHKLHFGKDCYMKRGVIWFEDHNCTLTIGDKTTIMEAGISIVEPNGKVTIGEDCMLSFGIDIRNSDSHSIIDLSSEKRINYSEDVVIGNHVWIGHEVQILKGSKIGNDSIVGSRSIVTKEHGENCIIVGSPAKVVKENVTWDRRRLYDC